MPLSGRFGQSYRYRLLHIRPRRNRGRFLAGLKSVEQVRKEANLAGVLTHLAPQNGHLAPTSQVPKREVQTRGKCLRNTRGWRCQRPTSRVLRGSMYRKITKTAGKAAYECQ